MMTHVFADAPGHATPNSVRHGLVDHYVSALATTDNDLLVLGRDQSCHSRRVRLRHRGLRVVVQAFNRANLDFSTPKTAPKDTFLGAKDQERELESFDRAVV